MNGAIKPRVKSSPSGSGTRPKVVASPEKTKTTLDDEFSAFFDQGDIGHYQEALAPAPASIEPITYDEPRRSRAPASTQRHLLLRRVVASVVAACMVLLLIAVGVKSISSLGRSRATGQGAGLRPLLPSTPAALGPSGPAQPGLPPPNPALPAVQNASIPSQAVQSEVAQADRTEPGPSDSKSTRPSTVTEPHESKLSAQKATRPITKREVAHRSVASASSPRARTASRTKTTESTPQTSPTRPSVAAFPVD